MRYAMQSYERKSNTLLLQSRYEAMDFLSQI